MKSIEKGFTLAEVLITLAIIGVVAALTIPTVVQNYKRHEASTRLKKFYSTMSRAIQMAEVEYATPSYKWGDKGSCCGNTYDEEAAWLEKYVLKYIKYSKIEPMKENDKRLEEMPYVAAGVDAVIHLLDGSDIIVDEATSVLEYDINGEKKPNKIGKDIFTFYILTYLEDETSKEERNAPRFNTTGWFYYRGPDREASKEECAGNYKSRCSHLLELDGWEFKSDYPLGL